MITQNVVTDYAYLAIE